MGVPVEDCEVTTARVASPSYAELADRLATLDSEERDLAESLKNYGVPDPEPVTGLPGRSWWYESTGRFEVCSVGCSNPECYAGRRWNAWADRRGLPRSETTLFPGRGQRNE